LRPRWIKNIRTGLNNERFTVGGHGEGGIGCIRVNVRIDDCCLDQKLSGSIATVETKGMLSVYALAVADGFVDDFAVDGGIHRHGMNKK